MYEFERGKGYVHEFSTECVAYYGSVAAIKPEFERGTYRPGINDIARPLRPRSGSIRMWDIYLCMRDRIGHKHFQGLRAPVDYRKKLKRKNDQNPQV